MSDEAGRSTERQQWAVGDQRRRAIGKAVFSTLSTAIVFFLFTMPTKQVKPVYDYAPWLNDPYDTLYSFAMFFVPLATAFFMVQVSLDLAHGGPAHVRHVRLLDARRLLPRNCP
jgi:hypothetical protein